MISLCNTNVFNWMRQNDCLSLCGLTDWCQREWVGETDYIWALVRMMEEVVPANNSEAQYHFHMQVKSNVIAEKLQRGQRLLPGLPHLCWVAPPPNPQPPQATNIHFPLNLNSSPHCPSLHFLSAVWVMGTDGWLLLAVSLGMTTPPLSPMPLVSCNWWLGCRDSHGIAMWALSHSLQAEGLWGGREGSEESSDGGGS